MLPPIMDGQTLQEKQQIETLIRLAFAVTPKSERSQASDRRQLLAMAMIYLPCTLAMGSGALYLQLEYTSLRIASLWLFLVTLGMAFLVLVMEAWAGLMAFVRVRKQLLEDGMHELWERSQLAHQLASLCTPTFLRFRLKHLKHAHRSLQIREALFVGEGSKTGLFGTIAIAGALVALARASSGTLPDDVATVISENAFPVFGAYILMVFSTRLTSVVRTELERGFLIFEEAIEIGENRDS